MRSYESINALLIVSQYTANSVITTTKSVTKIITTIFPPDVGLTFRVDAAAFFTLLNVFEAIFFTVFREFEPTFVLELRKILAFLFPGKLNKLAFGAGERAEFIYLEKSFLISDKIE